MDCSPPDSPVPGILQARVLAWVAISFSRALSWSRDQTHMSLTSPAMAGRFFTTSATWEAQAPQWAQVRLWSLWMFSSPPFTLPVREGPNLQKQWKVARHTNMTSETNEVDSSYLDSQPRGRGHCTRWRGAIGNGESSRGCGMRCHVTRGWDMPGSGRRFPQKDGIGLCR